MSNFVINKDGPNESLGYCEVGHWSSDGKWMAYESFFPNNQKNAEKLCHYLNGGDRNLSDLEDKIDQLSKKISDVEKNILKHLIDKEVL